MDKRQSPRLAASWPVDWNFGQGARGDDRMKLQIGRRVMRTGAAIAAIIATSLIAGCASQPTPRAKIGNKPQAQSKEYFAEKEYGVKASPRVTNKRSRLPRGGGRDQVGKPYQIKGKWYYPKEQPGYSKAGKASWYGDAFHGRLTANGEIYDMTHLSAAHPTMPLPSYARVTNLKNGSSVIVRVNDRGPYAHGRIIDLSKRAAEMLDYTHSGIAEVKVDYVGRAPLDGSDDEYLLASYKPGGGMPDPSDGMPTGVMIAMAGPTPTGLVAAAPAAASAFPGTLTNSGQPAPAANIALAGVEMAGSGAPSRIELPENGPVLMKRPGDAVLERVALAPLSYADDRVARAAGALNAMANGRLNTKSLSRVAVGTPASAAYVAAGTFADIAEAKNLRAALKDFGKVEIETSYDGAVAWHSVNIHTDGRATADSLLQHAWDAGAIDAFVVRD